ncbi:MAG: cytidylate kinase family protein [Firmicutes bacterium]|nr:cytidylate kinase family protein [Bacillota bacterium]
MFITLAGNLGSGKSTVCNILAERYGYEVYSTGRIQRDKGLALGMTTLEFNVYMKENPEFDKKIDNAVVEIGRERAGDKIIFDSRLAWHFIPHSFKVFLAVDSATAAKRILNANRGAEENYKDLADAKSQIEARTKEEKTRFKSLYGLEIHNPKNFDLILDSSNLTPEQVADKIIGGAKAYYNFKC